MPVPQWFVCKVVSAGAAEDGNVYVRLTDVAGAFGNRWFNATTVVRKEMLATALSAVATGFNVNAEVAAPTEYSVLNRLYLMGS